MTQPSLVVRRARPEDRESVLTFCRQTWDWGDYLPDVWDAWVASPEGQMLVGEASGRPVAVCRAVLAGPGEGWLEALRVDPASRRTGIGFAMSAACLAAARDLGARVVRFATLASNPAVHRIADRLGYRRVASYSVEEAPALAEPGPRPVALSPDQHAALFGRVASSPTYAATGGLEWAGWACRKLTREEFLRRLESGQVVAMPGQQVSALAIVSSSDDGQALVAEYLDSLEGPAEPLAELGQALRRLAADRSLVRAEARVPEVAATQEAMRRAGYLTAAWQAAPFWIFERQGKMAPDE